MSCYHPLTAWQSAKPAPNGKHQILFSEALNSTRIQLPCGQCIGCRLDRTRDWAIRCMHEAALHQDNCFITLTYSNDHIRGDGSLWKPHVQAFMKRLRKRIAPRRVSYYFAGEYGDTTVRPHYHAILFGFDFPDKELIRDGSNPLYSSPLLDDIWGLGHCSIGDVSFESAAYVASYCTKKVNGKKAKEERTYERFDSNTGEIFEVLSEFSLMSLKPAIGKKWYENYSSEVFPSDSVVVSGRPLRPPRYYDRILEQSDPELLETIKKERVLRAYDFEADNSPRRLRDREKVKAAKFKLKERSL